MKATTLLVSAERSALEFLAPSELRVDDRFAKQLPKPDNLDSIRDDVRRRGILVPLFVAKDNLVLDGHTRLELARELGLAEVPVVRLPVDPAEDWTRTVTLALNAHRRHLNAAQRAQLVTSLEKIEREKARARQSAAGGDKTSARRDASGQGSRTPKRSESDEDGRATARAARAAGVTRKTYERVKRVNKEAPEVARRMLAGEVSVKAAYKEVRAKSGEAARTSSLSAKHESRCFAELGDAPEKHYRCLYVDLAWDWIDAPPLQGGRKLTEEDLASLDLERIAHPRGSHVWLWATWDVLHEGQPQRLLERWGYRWVNEIVWHRGGSGFGHPPRSTTEVLLLGTKGILGVIDEDALGFLEVRGERRRKPDEARALVERCTSGPRIELLTKDAAPGWDAVEIASLRHGGSA